MTTHACQRIEACRHEIAREDAGAGPWLREVVRSVEDVARVIGAVAAAMTATGYSENDVYRVHLSLEEAIVNAQKHGHGGDWGKPVVVRCRIGPSGMAAQVEDEGAGFDPEQVPDPLAPENLERLSGRGLLIMRTYLSGVCHNERGNTICLCKHRSEDAGRAAAP